ncbi:probable methyltransferase TARBP1 isoform X2 [Scleropages formosus]|uniref:probable methyltransferase TARBP1 isoform X2 n=1 Tax=Scleropages formosus TaxID=113540 RepID=UPI0010FA7C85|nr:probable methyltransferase TARBP1 isoform X2 [Scleropages formosus]
MSSLLVEALVSNCSDPRVVLNALCWSTDTCPEPERVEGLAVLMGKMAKLPGYRDSREAGSAERADFQRRVADVAWELCVPLLCRLCREREWVSSQEEEQEGGTAEGRRRELLSAACRLLGVCVRVCGPELSERLVRSALPALRPPDADVDCDAAAAAGGNAPCPGRLDADVAVELLAAVSPALSPRQPPCAELLSSLLDFLKWSPDPLASKALVRVLLALLRDDDDDDDEGTERHLLLERCWAELCGWRASALTARALLCLAALSDRLFPRATAAAGSRPGRCDPWRSEPFWKIVQEGVTLRDAVSRKRAVFLLKRGVAAAQEEALEVRSAQATDTNDSLFRWVPSKSHLLREFWEDYTLVMETLDENQIHVVRPVLNRINTLIETTVSSSQGATLLHPSWLLCVYQRMFHSENKAVMREGVCHLLQLGMLCRPSFALAFAQFIVGPFMDVLAESSLFHRSPGQSIGECPDLGTRLQGFMISFFGGLPQEKRSGVLLQLIRRLASRHWGAVPILFLAQALSRIPPGPILGPDGLQALREVLQSTMITHQVLLRGAAQCFLLQSTLSLTDVSSMTLTEVFSFLTNFRVEESLCRGTALWDQVCDWLLDNERSFKPDPQLEPPTESVNVALDREPVQGFVYTQLKAFLRVPPCSEPTGSLPDPWDAELVARVVLLSADVAKRRPGGLATEGLEVLLHPLMDILRRLSTNAYVPLRKADRSLQLLVRVLQLRRGGDSWDAQTRADDKVASTIERCVLGVTEQIQEYILRRLSGELCELCDVERAELYHSVLMELVHMYTCVGWHRTSRLGSFVPTLTRRCLRILTEPLEKNCTVRGQVRRAVSMASLALLCQVGERHRPDLHPDAVCALSSVAKLFYSSNSSVAHLNQNLPKPAVTSDSLDGGPQEHLSFEGWGRMAARFVRDQWTCLRFLLNANIVSEVAELPPASLTLEAAVEALGLLPSDLVLPVLDCMVVLLPQVAQVKESLCVEAVMLALTVVLGLSSNPHDFWPSLEGFIRFAFTRGVLELADAEAPRLTATLQQVASELMELSQTKTGVFNVLIRHCCHSWLSPDQRNGIQAHVLLPSALSHLDILAEACVHGPVFRKDQRLIQEIQTYVEQLGGKCTANAVVTSDGRDEQFPRLRVLAFLSQLEASHPLHQRLIEELVLRLLKKDEEISKSKVRYYGNSLQHRVKNRVWQTLLVLLPKLSKEFVVTILSRVYEAGFCSNQASVKYLVEWMIILLLHRHPGLMDSLWKCFGVNQEKTKTSICTFLSVLVHLNVLLPNVQDKVGLWRKALDVILQWCFSHNFSIRLYALLALKKVWNLKDVRVNTKDVAGGPDGLGGLAAVVQACLQQAEAMQTTGNAVKNWTRIQDHFFFGTFHPLKDYSIETIFYTFPSLSELADDEWIPVWKFERLVEFPQNSVLPLRNPRQDLSQLHPGDWVQQDKVEAEREERWAEVQKKMTPWRLSIQEQDPELQLALQQRAARLGKRHSALLVVASLIDKPTNLGGLCRTCEIFGASTLVLDSLRHVSDKNFQALSVSAELWLPLLEVRPTDLVDFLQLKKREGYCIVGVEQTANSQSLQGYRFPAKTLLLLGNEREGIPANLLQLLDVCVEIPQHGVTRSLNVHVSAALLVWEYTRQHLSSGAQIAES